MTKRVYFDSNHWIKLAQVAKGKERDTGYKKIYEKIRNLSDSSAVTFPTSFANVYELAKHHNPKKREEMIDLIVDISKGWFLQPVTLFFKKEIENAIMHLLGKDSIHDINHEIVQKGISYFAGLDFDHLVKGTNMSVNFMDREKTRFDEFNEDLDIIKKRLKDLQSKVVWDDSYSKQIIAKQEKNRQNRQRLNKNVRKRFAEASSIDNLVLSHMTKFILDNEIPQSKIHSKLHDIHSMRKFIEDMPALNVFSKLVYARDEVSPERSIHENDSWDFIHFSGAIPYCDVLVAEKMFAGLSKRNNLGEKYDCVILTNLLDLQEIEFFNF